MRPGKGDRDLGYNFFKITQLKENFRQKLNTFVGSLGSAISDGKKISFADNDISYVLQLQHDRIKEKGLNLEMEIYDRDTKTNATVGSEWKDEHYESYVCNEQLGIKRKFTRDGKKIDADNKKSVLYTTITDVTTGIHPDDETISCPNCGSVSTIARIQGGCPYCGTVYKMDDLFPKVTSYYSLEDVGIAGDEHKTSMRLVVIITGIIFALIPVIANFPDYLALFTGRSDDIELIFTPFLLLPIGLLAGYFFYSIFLAIRLISVGSRQSAGKWGTIGSRAKFEQRMRAYSPEFSFEYFTSKAISLIKTAVYAPNEQELLFYRGGPMDPWFKDIIDLNYGGALGVVGIKEENGTVTITTDAFFDVLHVAGDKIKSKRSTFRAVFQRRTDIPIDMGFSMTKIQCPTCGGSFNAVQNKLCPHCGNAYDIESQDWVLVSIERE